MYKILTRPLALAVAVSLVTAAFVAAQGFAGPPEVVLLAAADVTSEPTAEPTEEPEATAVETPEAAETSEAAASPTATEPESTVSPTEEAEPTLEPSATTTEEPAATPTTVATSTVPPASPTSATQPTAGLLRQIDARADPGNCQASVEGDSAGEVQIAFDADERTVQFAIELEGGEPNTDYLVEVVECSNDGAWLARGDGGHFRTDANGQASFSGAWLVLTNAWDVKLSIFSYCATGGTDEPLTVPCSDVAFAAGALRPANR